MWPNLGFCPSAQETNSKVISQPCCHHHCFVKCQDPRRLWTCECNSDKHRGCTRTSTGLYSRIRSLRAQCDAAYLPAGPTLHRKGWLCTKCPAPVSEVLHGLSNVNHTFECTIIHSLILLWNFSTSYLIA